MCPCFNTHSILRILIQDSPERFEGHTEAMEEAFKEFNQFGLALQSENYRLQEKDCNAMKVGYYEGY